MCSYPPKQLASAFTSFSVFLLLKELRKYRLFTNQTLMHNEFIILQRNWSSCIFFQHLWFKNVNVSPLYATNCVSLKTQLILEDEKTSSKKSFFYYIKKYCLSCFPGQSAAFTFTTAEQVQVKVRQHKYLSQSDLQTSVFINQTKYMTYSPWLYTSKLTNHSLFVFKSSVGMM